MKFNENQWILALTDENEMTIYNLDNSKKVQFKPDHVGLIKSFQIDPTGKQVATTGDDGFLNIYKVVDDESVEHLTKQSICETKDLSESIKKDLSLDIQWLNGETLLITGKNSLGFL